MTEYVAIYGTAIVIASLLGGAMPIYVRLTHRRMQVATSVIAGFMLAVAMLHLLPRAVEAVSLDTAVGWMLGGVLAMFFIERFFSFHQHTSAEHPQARPHENEHQHHDPAHDHNHERDRDHAGHEPSHPHAAFAFDHPQGDRPEGALVPSHGRWSWLGMGLGLLIHSLVNGSALAAAVYGETQRGQPQAQAAALPGLAVFLLVALHKPFDAAALLTLLRGSGYERTTQHLVNFGFALAVPLGAVLFVLGMGTWGGDASSVIGPALAFAAGMFLCISLAILLPEVQFHKHDRLALSAAVLLGLVLAWAVHLVEARWH